MLDELRWWLQTTQSTSYHSRLQLLCKLCQTSPPPAMGARFTIFWACGPAGCLALLLTKAGDVEINLGPTTLNKKVWICDICHKQIHVRKQISIRCNMIEHWVHLRCAGIHQAQYTDTWTCHLHRESRLTSHKPPNHSPPTPPQPKQQTYVQHSPCPHRIGKAQTQFSHPLTPSPPTQPRAKHIHMSHTPPIPLTTTSPVLDKTTEPRVPLIHAHRTHTSPGPHTRDFDLTLKYSFI